MNITIEIKCPEMVEAINNLASAITIRAADQELKRDIAKPAAEKEDLHDPRHVGAALTGKPITPKVKAAPETADDGGDPRTANIEERAPALLPLSVLADDAIDYAQIKDAVMRVSKAKGREGAIELLKEFGAKLGGDLTEEQWGPFLARAEQVLA